MPSEVRILPSPPSEDSKENRIVSAGIAQLARARAFQARGRGFESRFPLQNLGKRNENVLKRDASKLRSAHVAQVVEHVLGKDEVSGSSPLVGSNMLCGGFGQAAESAALHTD